MLNLCAISDSEIGTHIIFSCIYGKFTYFDPNDIEIAIPNLISDYEKMTEKEFLEEYRDSICIESNPKGVL